MSVKLNHIWIVVWILIFLVGMKFNCTELLGNMGINTIHNEYYRFFTGLLVHANVVHLVANIVVLCFIVDFLYGQVSSFKLLAFSALIGIVSNILFSVIYRDSVSVGGSPIIFAMLGLLVAFQLHNKEVARFTVETLQGKWIVGYVILSNIPFFSGDISTLLIHGISLMVAFLIGCMSVRLKLM